MSFSAAAAGNFINCLRQWRRRRRRLSRSAYTSIYKYNKHQCAKETKSKFFFLLSYSVKFVFGFSYRCNVRVVFF
jgi:hypothetical protein